MNTTEPYSNGFNGSAGSGSAASGSPAAIRIGAIIPTFNRAGSLRNLLDCLQQQLVTGMPFTILPVVVVDGSRDGTLEMLAQDFPLAEIVQGDGNWWYTRSINEGIKKARQLDCNFILTLNDDITFDQGYIDTLIRDHFDSGPDSIIGSVSLSTGEPRLITFSGVSRINLALKEFNYFPKFSPVAESALSGLKPSVVLSGRGILYPSEIFDRFGLYDEKLVQYSSETDFTYTATRNKIPVLISYNARVYENIKLTSAGAIYNNPSLSALIRSFTNKYSINSFKKARYYSIKHRGPVLGSLLSLWRTIGLIRNFALIKLKNKG